MTLPLLTSHFSSCQASRVLLTVLVLRSRDSTRTILLAAVYSLEVADIKAVVCYRHKLCATQEASILRITELISRRKKKEEANSPKGRESMATAQRPQCQDPQPKTEKKNLELNSIFLRLRSLQKHTLSKNCQKKSLKEPVHLEQPRHHLKRGSGAESFRRA